MSEFYLKILSGNHIGAEIPLTAGTYRVGRSEQCDLVLTDHHLADQACIIEINASGQIVIQPDENGQGLLVTGEHYQQPFQYQFFDVIAAGMLLFALGPVDQPWPTLQLPDLHEIKQTEHSAEQLEDDKDDEIGGEIELFSDELDINFQDEDDVAAEKAVGRPSKQKIMIGVSVAIIMVLLAGGLFISGGSDIFDDEPLSVVSALDVANSIKAELALPAVNITEQSNGILDLTGYVPALQDKSDLQLALQMEGIPFNVQVTALQEMRDNAEIVTQSAGYDALTLTLSETPGVLILSGYVATSDELAELVALLEEQIYGLKSIEENVETVRSRADILRRLLREKGLMPRANISVANGAVLLRTRLLDEAQQSDLRGIIQKFQKQYGNNPRVLIANGGSAAERQQVMSLEIKGVSIGQVPYIILSDGSKYLLGAELSDGYILKEIHADYLLLSNGAEQFKYRLGGNRGGS